MTGVVAVTTVSTGPAQAAPPSGNVVDNTPQDTVVPGERTTVADLSYPTPGNVSQVDVNLSAGNEAANVTPDDVNFVEVTLYDSAGTELTSNRTSYDALTTDVQFGGNVTNVARVEIRAETSQFGAEDNDIFDAVVTVSDAAGAITTRDTDNNQTVEDDTGARLRGEVRFQNGSIADNVTIKVVNIDTGNTLRDDITTRGFDTNQPGTWGPIVASPGNYTVTLDDEGTQQSDLLGTVEVFSTQVNLEDDETETIDTTLDPIRQVGPVDCTSVQVFADETGTFTITVRDEEGDRLGGADITLDSRTGSNVVQLVGDNADGTATTEGQDDNDAVEIGQAQFDVAAIPNTTASATFTFNVTNGGDTEQVQCSAIFVQNGEGYLSGDVRNAETTGPVQNARVWAVLGSSYAQNEFYTRINLSTFGEDDNVVWVRLVNRETGEAFGPEDVIDNDDYDIRNDEYNRTADGSTNETTGGLAFEPGEDTGVRLIEQMNVTDSADGQGFALVDLDEDGQVAFNHTRIAPEDYFVQIALDAPNASRAQGVARDKQQLPEDQDEIQTSPFWPGEVWQNVTNLRGPAGRTITSADTVSAGDDGFDTSATNAIYFSPPADLTYQQTVQIAQLADSNLVDAPGFVNSFGTDTAGTDASGDFVLNKLYTEFQQGRAYVAIAEKAGFSTDFHDVIVEEDGEIKFADSENREAFQLQPEPVEVNVNVTNLAVLPSADDAPANASEPGAYSQYYFGNQSDNFSQRLSRDGSSIDVIQVDTTAAETGAALNDTVTLSVPDTDPEAATATPGSGTFAGDFVAVAGGTVVSEDEVNNTITLATGEDGQAIVWLQTDFEELDLASVDIDANDEVIDDAEVCSVATNDAGEVVNEFFSGVVAQSTSDVDATDETCKSFEGVTAFENASLSGFLSDRVDNRVSPTFVYLRNTRWDNGDELIRITPADPQNPTSTTYTVAYYSEDFTDVGPSDTFDANPIPSELVTEQTGVTATELGAFTFNQFPSITDVGGPFKLAEFSPAGDSEYTLKPVPAVPPSTGPPTTTYDVRGIALDRVDNAGNLEIGNATAATKPGFTDDANIAFDFRARTDFQVTDLSAPSEAQNGSAFTVTANVTNDGTTSGTQTVEFRVDLDQDGTLESDEVLLSTALDLGVQETQQVSFDVPAGATSDLNGTFLHGVVTPSDQQTAQITIGPDVGSPSPQCPDLSDDVAAYAGEDCAVSTDELNTAIQDWSAGDISTDTLNDVINVWAMSG